MYLMLSFEDRPEVVEAVLLAVDKRRIRVALKGGHDTLELDMNESRWTTATGCSVDLQSIIPIQDGNWAELAGDVFPLVRSAN